MERPAALELLQAARLKAGVLSDTSLSSSPTPALQAASGLLMAEEGEERVLEVRERRSHT